MYCCGIDEAGRGPLAGPVYAAAVVLGANGERIVGIDDSKRLTAVKRDRVALEIKAHAVAWAIASATAEEVDQLNILQATMLAMFRAVSQLPESLMGRIVIDGTQIPRDLKRWASKRGFVVVAQPRADADVREVGAASILAKTARDAYMLEVHTRFPEYNFATHKGYGTAVHMAALAEHGPCIEHRRSFAPVAQWKLL
ncbi:MAG: ribonuclease HII [Casimicrobium sp.]